MKKTIASIAAVKLLVLASQLASAQGTVLEPGNAVNGINGNQNQELLYQVEVAPGTTNLTVTLKGGFGDADLYMRYNNAVTVNSFDCRSWNFYNNETCTFNNPEAGTYNIMVRGYSNFMGATLLAQVEGGGSVDPIDPVDPVDPAPTVTELQKDEAVTDLSLDSGNAEYFSIAVPANAENLSISIEGGTGDAELFVKYGELPTQTEFDCQPNLEGNAESCVFEAPIEGTYNIMLYAYSSYADVTLVATYDEVVPTEPTCSNLTPEMQALLDAHNEARATGRSCGSEGFFEAAPPLTWSCQLGEAALGHSVDMATNNFISHTGSDGSNHGQRIRNTGYQPWYTGENVAAGQQNVDSVMSSWLGSDGHCANVMNPNFTEYGGARQDNSAATYRIYWTSVFASPAP